MWGEKVIKIIPSVLFLFCLLEVFEMFLVITDLNKTEKLETEVRNNLKALKDVTILNKHLENTPDKETKIKKCNRI